LEARIEAETATRYRERRRAAKIARRIAALPTTVSQADAFAAATTDTWAPQSSPQSSESSPNVVDLPDAAVREVTSRPVVDPPAELVPALEAEPVPALDVEPAVGIDEIAPVAPEPVVEPPPASPKRRLRRRAPKALRLEEPSAEVEEAPPLVPLTETAEAVPVAEVVEPVAVVEPPVPVEIVEPVEVVARPVPVEVVEVVEPDEPVESVVEPAAFTPANWQRPNSAWIDRVFAAPGLGRSETVTWPRPRTPADQSDEAAG
jgi:hypothetical protein